MIKFRGISEESGRYVYGCLIQSRPNKVDGDCTSWIKRRDSLMLGALSTPTDTFAKVKTSTVGQFTGVTDPNGVEVYAGDIIQYPGANEVAHVVFVNGAFIVLPAMTDEPELASRACGYGDYEGHAVVIGNIHQNPELILSGESK